MTAIILNSPFYQMIDRLTQTYRAVLVQIARDLDEEQQKELQFLCTGLVPRRVKDILTLFHSLEEATKMSWVDVAFLKECLHDLGREDLVAKLTAFEIKRDVSILLNFYVKKRNGLHSFYQSSATNAAEYLVQLMEGFQGRVDVREMLRSSGKNTKDLWLHFVKECTPQSQRMTWGKFSMLVAIAGEIIAVSSSHSRQSPPEEAIEMCITLANELCYLMLKLGCWEDFCTYVKKRYNQVYHGHDDIGCSSPSLSFRRQIADVVQELEEAIFF
ncbi:hypothetical protein OS493_029247 [Desmophyllum pertusum]|uniref:DED domain-containing protein n=1 Tax=Desmophyllum pertusum TaxID=174260 RepID=A0A9W9ZKF6_9CNID|nr:hypothetical protein OS493_029247 [Desmophyllum pertusum]